MVSGGTEKKDFFSIFLFESSLLPFYEELTNFSRPSVSSCGMNFFKLPRWFFRSIIFEFKLRQITHLLSGKSLYRKQEEKYN